MIIDNAKLKMEKQNVIKQKSFTFAIEIVTLYKILSERKEFVLSKQLLRSGTSIGANLREAEHAQTKLILLVNCQLH